jgi:Transposase
LSKRRDEPAHEERGATDSREKDSADLPPVALAAGTPTRSVTQMKGAQERSAMRNIGLDLGAKKISFCEVQDGKVVARRTVSSLAGLDDVLGVDTPKARVAIEACREAWHVHDELVRRGHEVKLVDTTRVKKLGIGQHGRKTDRIDAEVLARALESGHIPERMCCRPTGGRCART